MLKKIKSGLLFLKYSNEIESDYEINLGNNHIWTWYKVQILEMLFSTKLMNVIQIFINSKIIKEE